MHTANLLNNHQSRDDFDTVGGANTVDKANTTNTTKKPKFDAMAYTSNRHCGWLVVANPSTKFRSIGRKPDEPIIIQDPAEYVPAAGEVVMFDEAGNHVNAAAPQRGADRPPRDFANNLAPGENAVINIGDAHANAPWLRPPVDAQITETRFWQLIAQANWANKSDHRVGTTEHIMRLGPIAKDSFMEHYNAAFRAMYNQLTENRVFQVCNVTTEAAKCKIASHFVALGNEAYVTMLTDMTIAQFLISADECVSFDNLL